MRLVVTSADGTALTGMDRKVLTALDDPTLRAGFPKRLGAGGEAPIRYADLDGDNRQELVVPTEDGRVHAYEPDGSRAARLAGAHARPSTRPARTSAPRRCRRSTRRASRRAAPTIADLDGDGRPEVITTAGERIYAWDADGHALPGWPVRPDPTRANCAPSQQSKPLKHPKCGFLAAPGDRAPRRPRHSRPTSSCPASTGACAPTGPTAARCPASRCGSSTRRCRPPSR